MAKLPDGIKIQWLGHSTFIVTAPGGERLLLEAFVENNPVCPLKNDEIGTIDAILITHGHMDHVADLLDIARATGAPVVCIPEIANWLSTQGIENVLGMNKGGTLKVAGCGVHMTTAVHSGGLEIASEPIYGGEPAGYVIEFENSFSLYHAGDTCVTYDMALIGKLLTPDWALLPIGDHYTMGPRSAAEAIRLLGVKTVVPMHYGTFPVLVGTPEALREEAKDIDGLEVFDIEPGDVIE